MKKNYCRPCKIIFFIALLIVLSGCAKKASEENRAVTINDKVINVEIADSWPERMQGLSGRDSLCIDCGLLFFFDDKDKHSFWMKEMNFSIDIIWIDNDKIVYIVKNASLPKGDNIPTYIPTAGADKVLEVNAGFAEKYNIKLGDTIKIN